MNPETKKNLQEWRDNIIIAIICTIFVFNINNSFSSDKKKDKTPVKTETKSTVQQNTQQPDSIAQYVLNNKKQFTR